MIKVDDIKIGNKYRSLATNDMFEIINIYRGLNDILYIKLKDKKCKTYEVQMKTFIHKLLEKIKE